MISILFSWRVPSPSHQQMDTQMCQCELSSFVEILVFLASCREYSVRAVYGVLPNDSSNVMIRQKSVSTFSGNYLVGGNRHWSFFWDGQHWKKEREPTATYRHVPFLVFIGRRESKLSPGALDLSTRSLGRLFLSAFWKSSEYKFVWHFTSEIWKFCEFSLILVRIWLQTEAFPVVFVGRLNPTHT